MMNLSDHKESTMYKKLDYIDFPSDSIEYFKILIRIGKNIRLQRIEKEYSLTDLSLMTDISLDYLSKIENGKAPKVSIYKYLSICIALKLNPTDLMHGVNELIPFSKDTK